jgi:AcrR family transcriptional regulator
MAAGTREKLLRAARDVLIDEGLSELSMRRVAAACDVSATAVYRHFADKDELLTQAALESFKLFGAYLMDGLERKTPIERLRTMSKRYFDFAREHRQDFVLIFMTDRELLGLSRLDETSKREISGTFQLFQDRIAECQKAGVVRKGDTKALASWWWASLHGLAALTITGHLSASPKEQAALQKQQLEMSLAALGR